MEPRPSVIVFDVNETLSDMAPMAQRFADVGAPGCSPRHGSPLSCGMGSRRRPPAVRNRSPGSPAARWMPCWPEPARIRGEFEHLLSVEDAPAWKPAPVAYAYAARACSVPVGQMLLVAVHPWDIHGARQAGLRTGWITRGPASYPDYFAAPDLQAPDLRALARQILS